MARHWKARTLATAIVGSTALALGACGGDDGGTSTGTSAGTSAAADAQPTGKMTIWTYYDEGSGGLFNAVPKWKAAVEKRFPKLQLEFQTVGYDDLTRKLTAAAAAGKGPDIAMVNGGDLPQIVKAGAALPIDAEWDGYADKGQFPAPAEDSLKLDGKRYGVYPYTNVVGLYYNEKILKDIGVEPPQDLDQLDAALAKAAAKGYKPLTVSAPSGAGGEFNLAAWLLSSGWTYDKPDAPQGKQVMERLGQWREKNYIEKADSGGFNGATNFAGGKYAFSVEGNWNLGTFEKEIKFPYGIQSLKGLDRSPIGGEAAIVGGNAKDKGAAWAVIREMVMSKAGGLVAAEAGSVPLRKDVASDPSVTGNEKLSSFAAIAAKSTGIPLGDNTGKVSQIVGSAYNELIAGKLNGAAAFDKIAKELPPLQQG